ncbi:hypothetical protein SNE40_023483 [Patella caerulea]|uniref:Uncharacterized protein n=1 Tax=Patella caerulea TaxID=87958 RepID=A0AAN8FYK1_PATCE
MLCELGTSILNSLFLFDRMVIPVLTYGSDVWGYETYHCIEAVHLKFCRRLLSLNSNVPKLSIYGELGRNPIHVLHKYNMIKYWLKINFMPLDRYPKACYDILYTLHCSGRQTWASHVKSCLDNLGISYAWISHGVTDVTILN